ncbi:phosphoinositide phosphatase SAC8-like isoform X1 [Gossypium australe]|uniref:Phosphoinositide phosphatase SAC8-like isoform X1 n=1 Tax=Gossypium australe TaxID=47621 RepID=A0A5B6V3Y3_9ROSI|nr:phosphoinositide phosphatase SAC8-like isoform X1 [Gossypium australe]
MEVGSSSSNFKLYDQFELLEYEDRLVFKSLESPDKGFSICRHESSSGKPSKTSTIYGVAGTIRLLAGTYVLVITSRKEVGSFLGFPVYRVESMKFLSCNEALRFSNSQEKRDEAYFMSLLKTVEATPGLYYSYETDITVNVLYGYISFTTVKLMMHLIVYTSLQRRCKLMEAWTSKPLWKQADPRFVWNKHLLEELIEYKLKLKSSPATFTLLSRRCTRRLGTRMWRRGANLEGDTANFIETEQLLELEGFRCSSLQPQVVERHFNDLYQRYGETIAVDLTDKHGDEGQLSAAYAEEMQKLPNVRYFLIDKDGKILEEQKGIIRSNCIDCLDRTNVTQSYLAQKTLDIQLQRLGVFSSTEYISMFPEDYVKFRTLWAEQGDEISLEYAGTHALKGDLVRYGKQTDALDLVSGRYTVSKSNPSPFQLNSFESFSYLPVASALLIGGLTLTTFSLQQAARNAQHYVSSVVWAGVTAGAMALVKANGRQFCSRPRLCRLL